LLPWSLPRRSRLTLVPAQAQNDTGAVQKADTGVSPPKVIFQPEPDSDKARAAGFQGICTLGVTVEADGTTSHIKVISPLGMGLDEKAMEAVSKWRFQPARKDGKAVAVQIAIEIDFHLPANPKAEKIAKLGKNAASGDPKAEFQLAKEYLTGRNLPQDEHYGMVLLERASNRGFAPAQFELAEHLMHATSPDYTKAFMWYALAQRNGEKHNRGALRKLTAQMTPEQLQAGKSLVDNWTPAKD